MDLLSISAANLQKRKQETIKTSEKYEDLYMFIRICHSIYNPRAVKLA
jgi:hypothetical protein